MCYGYMCDIENALTYHVVSSTLCYFLFKFEKINRAAVKLRHFVHWMAVESMEIIQLL